MNRVLLVGEEEGLQSVVLALRALGVEATTARDARGAEAALRGPDPYEAVVATLDNFSAGAGLRSSGSRRIALVKAGDLEELGSALGRELDDALLTPLRAEDLWLALRRPQPVLRGAPMPVSTIIGKEHGLANAWKILERSAGFDTAVLIRGESGTGKEVFARELHRLSKREGAPFVAVNCAAIPQGLLESQLFGHVRGAFTDAHQDKRGVFLEANGGTLFLDEVGDFPLELQAKLLRALQTGEIQPVGSEETIQVDLRLVSATSRDLDAMVLEKTFRDDLFYRLAVIPIDLPSLRERREDLGLLIDHFLELFARRHALESMSLDEDARELLIQGDWPGNVRQLQNAIERMVVLSEGVHVSADFVRQEFTKHVSAEQSEGANVQGVALRGRPLKEAMHEIEAMFIAEALSACSGKRARCAELLSISPRALLYKIKEHDL